MTIAKINDREVARRRSEGWQHCLLGRRIYPTPDLSNLLPEMRYSTLGYYAKLNAEAPLQPLQWTRRDLPPRHRKGLERFRDLVWVPCQQG